MKIIEKLSTYAALVGVIGAIGGGFYTWGQFNTRLRCNRSNTSC
jgi:nitrate/TMAO reductase-like tetraheme cytochrome c subunit